MADDDPKLGPLALHLLAMARVVEMRQSVEDLSELCNGLERSSDFLPPLSDDPNARQIELLALLLQERDRSRRLLALLAA